MKFCEYIYHRLQELSYDHVFGLPGYYIMPLWQQFISKRPNLVLATHEASAVYMADGWTRFNHDKPAVVLVTLGPGITNTITGVASAYKDSIPMIIISGQAKTTDISSGSFQECAPNVSHSFSPAELLKPITKMSLEITDKKKAVDDFEKALKVSMSGRKGPVYLSIPLDVQLSDVAPKKGYNFKPSFKKISHKEKIIKLINQSERPLIISGWGVFLSNTENLLKDFSTKLSAPILTTIKGLSTIDSHFQNFIGHIGHGQRKETMDFLEKYKPDLTIVLGASLSSYYLSAISTLLNNTKIINVNLEKNTRINCVNVLSDLTNFFGKILPNLKQKNKHLDLPLSFPSNIQGKHIMANSIALLNNILPANSIVVPDAGNHWLNTLYYCFPQKINGFFTNAGLAGMAHAIGFSIGLAFTQSKRKIICISGDGSFLMGGNEIITAQKYRLNVLFIVFNNSSLGRIRIAQKQNFKRNYVATSLNNVSYTKLGDAFSIKSYVVKSVSGFKKKVQKALKYKGSVLIEVISSSDEIPPCLEERKQS